MPLLRIVPAIAFLAGMCPKRPAEPEDADSPVECILSFADRSGVDVYAGLVEDPRYWEWLNGDAETLAASLGSLNARSIAWARRNIQYLRKHRSFAGWYIPQEIHDASWQTVERRRLLLNLLGDLCSQLHTLAPRSAVRLSGFTTLRSKPDAVEEFWNDLLGSADIDTLLFQDGIGVRNLSIELLPAYLDAIHRSTTRHRRRLQVIVELFEQLPAPPGTSATFQAVPAEITRIWRQLIVAARYGRAVAFSIPEYMSPLAGPEAALLLEAYIHEVL